MDYELKIKGIQHHGPERTTVRCLECELRERDLLSWKELSKQITLDVEDAKNRGLLDGYPVDVLIEVKKATAYAAGEYKNLEVFRKLVCGECKQPLIATSYRYTCVINGHTKFYKSANKSKLIEAYLEAVEQPDFSWAILFDEITGDILCWREMVSNTLEQSDKGVARVVGVDA